MTEQQTIVIATINGERIQVDLASTDKHAYQDLKEKIGYLGRGTYYIVDGAVQRDATDLIHFWKWKKKRALAVKNITANGWGFI